MRTQASSIKKPFKAVEEQGAQDHFTLQRRRLGNRRLRIELTKFSNNLDLTGQIFVFPSLGFILQL